MRKSPWSVLQDGAYVKSLNLNRQNQNRLLITTINELSRLVCIGFPFDNFTRFALPFQGTLQLSLTVLLRYRVPADI